MADRHSLRDIARDICDQREWGDLRTDATARAYYNSAVECVMEALRGDRDPEGQLQRHVALHQQAIARGMIADAPRFINRVPPRD